MNKYDTNSGASSTAGQLLDMHIQLLLLYYHVVVASAAAAATVDDDDVDKIIVCSYH